MAAVKLVLSGTEKKIGAILVLVDVGTGSIIRSFENTPYWPRFPFSVSNGLIVAPAFRNHPTNASGLHSVVPVVVVLEETVVLVLPGGGFKKEN